MLCRKKVRKQKDADRERRNALKLENEVARLAARNGRPEDNTGEASGAISATAKTTSPAWELQESKNILTLFKRSTEKHLLGGGGPSQKRKQIQKRATKVGTKIISAVRISGRAASGSSTRRTNGRAKGSSSMGETKRDDKGRGAPSTRGRDVSDSTSYSAKTGKSESSTRSSSEGDTRARKRRRHKTKARARYARPKGFTVVAGVFRA